MKFVHDKEVIPTYPWITDLSERMKPNLREYWFDPIEPCKPDRIEDWTEEDDKKMLERIHELFQKEFRMFKDSPTTETGNPTKSVLSIFESDKKVRACLLIPYEMDDASQTWIEKILPFRTLNDAVSAYVQLYAVAPMITMHVKTNMTDSSVEIIQPWMFETIPDRTLCALTERVVVPRLQFKFRAYGFDNLTDDGWDWLFNSWYAYCMDPDMFDNCTEMVVADIKERKANQSPDQFRKAIEALNKH